MNTAYNAIRIAARVLPVPQVNAVQSVRPDSACRVTRLWIHGLTLQTDLHLPIAVADLVVTESVDLWKSGKSPVGRVNLVGIGRNARKVTLRVAGRGASGSLESGRRWARTGPRIELKRGIFKRTRSVPNSGYRSRGVISGLPGPYVRETDNA